MTTAPENVEDFGDEPEDFDLDAWIEQAARPRRTVEVFQNWELYQEYEQLLARKAEAKQDDGPEESMGDVGVDEQIADVLERLSASRLVFVVQQLTNEEIKALTEKAPMKVVKTVEGKPVLNADGEPRKRVDEVALGDMMTAAAVISMENMATGHKRSNISAKQVKRIRTAVGDGPTWGLQNAVAELIKVGQVVPSVPSSREP